MVNTTGWHRVPSGFFVLSFPTAACNGDFSRERGKNWVLPWEWKKGCVIGVVAGPMLSNSLGSRRHVEEGKKSINQSTNE
jgi:hypothetical protein